MRMKTEAKREAIITVARQVFLECGYERASMGQIAEQVGGSKGTLYSYFASKQALFLEVITQAGKQEFEPVLSLLQPDTPDLSSTLRGFGEKFLMLISRPDVLASRRAVLAEAGQSDIGARFYESGPKLGQEKVTEFIANEMQRGRLRDADPGVAAMQLMALLEAETLHRLMLGVLQGVSRAASKRMVERAIATFLAAYSVPAPVLPSAQATKPKPRPAKLGGHSRAGAQRDPLCEPAAPGSGRLVQGSRR